MRRGFAVVISGHLADAQVVATMSSGRGEVAKTVAAPAAAVGAGAVLSGIVGAVAVGGVVGWLSYKRWLATNAAPLPESPADLSRAGRQIPTSSA